MKEPQPSFLFKLQSFLLGSIDFVFFGLYPVFRFARKSQFFRDGTGCQRRFDYAKKRYEEIGQPAELEVSEAEWKLDKKSKTLQAVVSYESPAADFLESSAKVASAYVVLPQDPSTPADLQKPPSFSGPHVRGWVVLQAATGEEGFRSRIQQFALPLASRGVASVIVEIPYYRSRRMPKQKSYALPEARHALEQGVGTAIECAALVRWLRKRGATGPLVYAGRSFGGTTATLASLCTSDTHGVVAWCGADSPFLPFSEGVLRVCVPFGTLGEEETLKVKAMLRSINGEGPPKFSARRLVRIVYGLNDHFVPPESSRGLARALRECGDGTHVEEELLAGGHVSILFGRRIEYLDDIVRTLERVRLMN
uniref:Peptidase S9 prolyl oligopeptidase catalytic domain-containing protein n=1 Tax=Chromera velia CCMP2878 TaxID=1169474 RepID=A0A0G4I8W0_9ALVE|eukprot:Cvel_12054.t1-p1 / transcript=Cvel_12054.t1 / gene=Cvel_12054 / organism=Chromera_velia_CCMP2878 / gene_product=hypothetical protein / transcript_product=hypothetical protein / location=Cvel_scaffold774:66458-67928(-) / protein_length=365 / sequence_SO=supercontig / SO=protein_coding / is_pseudo=false